MLKKQIWSEIVGCMLVIALMVTLFSGLSRAQTSETVFVYHPVMWQQRLHLIPILHQLQAGSSGEVKKIDEAVNKLLHQQSDSPTSFLAGLFDQVMALNSVQTQEKTVILDFDSNLRAINVGAWGEKVMVQAIVKTALAAAGEQIQEVVITLDGDTAETLAGHICLQEPLTPRNNVLWPGEYSFADHWAHTEMLTAATSGIVQPGGIASDLQKPITRGEFVRTAVKSVGFEEALMAVSNGEAYPLPFTDIDTDSPLIAHLRIAVAEGIIRPDDYAPEYVFEPESPVTRREVLVMSTRIAMKSNKSEDISKAPVNNLQIDQYPRWLEKYCLKALRFGIVQGYPDSSLRLQSRASTAEAVSMITRAMGYNPDLHRVAVVQPHAGAAVGPGQPVLGITTCKPENLQYKLKCQDDSTSAEGNLTRWPKGSRQRLDDIWFSFTLPDESNDFWDEQRNMYLELYCTTEGEVEVSLPLTQKTDWIVDEANTKGE